MKIPTLAVLTLLTCPAALASAQNQRSLFDEAQVEHLGALSSDGFEAKPDISHDLLTLFFASTQPPNEGELDLFMATRPAQGAPFGPQSNVLELNSAGRDHTPTTNADHTYIIFSSSRDGGAGSDDAWESSRPDTASPWGEPSNIAVLNSPERDMGFTMTPDALCLYFSSNRDKPDGALDDDFDIYVSTRPDTASAWSAPVPVPELNTIPFADKFPSVTGDNLTMYFASDRPGSELDDMAQPSQDTWVAMRPDTASPWEILEPVYETNTGFNEYLMSIADDHSELFFVSDRPGGLGGFDLYRAPAIPGTLRYGAGTDGAFGVPRLRPLGGAPEVANPAFALEITQVTPDAVGFLLVSADVAAGPVLISLESALFVRLVFQEGAGEGGGTVLPAPVPADPGLLGMEFALQALALDEDGDGMLGKISFSASPGLRLEILAP